ncbi:30S ribosomal protein S3 [Candidatus Giovannonibacteria bacterium RIFCSPHIGHO2_02_FULL_46_20]|uniref:Small ribosomal subunit protein uS3 n=1 Tax=Candidatus Giovannonibacteria bacterium RIFCSPHIGHO2_02_FULL_46_20 TaxID=1798338 RepID=A0A1F5WFT7_9BACT|nr:MAG: 30S ribosomal protein S3 [Candidatus Giovannonibacteria bacterium RIFCSPHIGHO2_02_FULL_46_20]
MSHISNPYAVRIGVLRTWRSRWFSDKEYRSLLREDLAIRDFLQKRLRGMAVDSVEIERTPLALSIVIKTARPGLLIGRGGEGAEKLKNEIYQILAKTRGDIAMTRKPRLQQDNTGGKRRRQSDMRLVIEEVKIPEAHANIMVEQIAQDLEKRLPFRRVMKQTLSKMMASRGVVGAKISFAGRLDGSEMARFEWLKNGKIPLQTLRADVDFARGRAHLPYGDIGIKVWVYRGEIFDKK